MRIIYNESTCPYFNLAAEEHLAKSFKEDIFMLWRNSSAVIIGRNQEPLSEVDLEFTKREKIPVIRRITGGGAVFHDAGNINYTFITEASEGIDFKRFAAPITDALEKLGVRAELGGRNDIVASGFKISGNAQCRVQTPKGYVTLHHGTLLFSADMSRLSSALRPHPLKLESKGIKSVSSRVKNIVDFDTYRGEADPEAFIFQLFSLMDRGEPCGLTSEERRETEALAEKKYRTWEWNFGASPAFETVREGRFPFGTVSAGVSCRGDKIEKIRLTGDFFGEDVSRLERLLEGVHFEKEAVLRRLSQVEIKVEDCIYGASEADVIGLLFS